MNASVTLCMNGLILCVSCILKLIPDLLHVCFTQEETSEKLSALQEQLNQSEAAKKEIEDKSNKFKMVAIKTKRELADMLKKVRYPRRHVPTSNGSHWQKLYPHLHSFINCTHLERESSCAISL